MGDFLSSREHWAPMLGLDSRGLTNSNMSVMKGKMVEQDTWRVTRKFQSIFHHLELGAYAVLFIVGDQGSYYNVINALNYLPHQYSTRSGG
jgi:hypothetical protein